MCFFLSENEKTEYLFYMRLFSHGYKERKRAKQKPARLRKIKYYSLLEIYYIANDANSAKPRCMAVTSSIVRSPSSL